MALTKFKNMPSKSKSRSKASKKSKSENPMTNARVNTAEAEHELEEHNEKLMKKFGSVLSNIAAFMLPAMLAVLGQAEVWSKMTQEGQAGIIVTFHVAGHLCLLALIVSHATNATRWTRVVSLMTQAVCMAALELHHRSISLFIPAKYWDELTMFKDVLFVTGVGCILFFWGTLFELKDREGLPKTQELEAKPPSIIHSEDDSARFARQGSESNLKRTSSRLES
ncbi:hypothetical protein ACP70R_045174 [Stipagrostis hirtigluma subsp. patula]